MIRQSKSKFQVKNFIVIVEIRKPIFLCFFQKQNFELPTFNTYTKPTLNLFGIHDYENFFLKALPNINVFIGFIELSTSYTVKSSKKKCGYYEFIVIYKTRNVFCT